MRNKKAPVFLSCETRKKTKNPAKGQRKVTKKTAQQSNISKKRERKILNMLQAAATLTLLHKNRQSVSRYQDFLQIAVQKNISTYLCNKMAP